MEITILLLVAAIAILGWGFSRARSAGKLGILSWLQAVVLMTPWLVVFGLAAVGIYLNVILILLMLIVSTVIYIVLGNRLRAASQEAGLHKRLSTMAKSSQDASRADRVSTSSQAASQTDSVVSQLPEFAPIPAEDLKAIQGIFGADTFFATETIPYQSGAIFKGNLRGNPETTYQSLSDRVAERLGDRYRLFLVENRDGKPIVIVLPSENDPKPTTLPQKVLAVVLLLATLATCLERGIFQYGFGSGFNLFENLDRYREALPLAGGIFGVLAAHEMGHRFLARRYQVRLSPPFLIPAWQIGSFGAITRFESLLPNRTVLFDIAFAGPAIGGLISLVLLIGGFLLDPGSNGLQIPSDFFRGSILVGTLARVVLGSEVQAPVLTIHPLTVVGWIGLVITALNLLPAGQLDGGRIVQAIYGRKVAGRTTFITLIFLAIASFANPLALYWALLILLLQRNLERPALNELTEPNDARAALGLLALFLTAAMLLPLTPSLAGQLGIGMQ